ncbi:MAG: chorismate mutase [Frankiaceae bacterium]
MSTPPSAAPLVAPPVPTAAAPADEIAAGRARIDELDAQIIALVQQRIAVSRGIQLARLAAGGRRLEHGREVEVVNRYAVVLGQSGADVALAVLALSRGAAGAPGPLPDGLRDAPARGAA